MCPRRWKNLIFFSVFVSYISTTNSQGPRDGCSLRIRKPFNRIAYERTNPKCTSGKIWWSYPSGKLVVEFEYEEAYKPFLLCLILKPDQSNIKFFDISEGKRNTRELPFSKPGFYTCVPDYNGRVSVLLDGPFFPITYLYMLEYRLLIDWEPTARLSATV